MKIDLERIEDGGLNRQDVEGVAVLTIRHDRVLNALSESILTALSQQITRIHDDQTIDAVVITGFGDKAFVAGANIRELAAMDSPQKAHEKAQAGQRVFNQIEQLGKPVIAALNGLAFGGGGELALACHTRIATAGLKVLFAQPEPKLGIIPGYGATQRLPRIVGMTAANELLRTAKVIGSDQCETLGLVSLAPAAELLDKAISLAIDAAKGRVSLPPISQSALDLDGLDEVDIGPLSRAIDQLLCRALTEGLKKPLAEGLAIEAQLFADCLKTEDFQIGMQNFIKNGPKVAAAFVHR